MSNYWTKKLDELEQKKPSLSSPKTTSSTQSRNYWQKKLDVLEEEERKKKQREAEKKITVGSLSGGLADIAPVRSDKEDDRKWYEKAGETAKRILGVSDMTAESAQDPAPDMTLDEIAKLRDAAKDRSERAQYASMYNQKYVIHYSEILANTQMDGTDHSVLEEMAELAEMKGGKEKKARKAAVLDKMKSLGINPDNYALFTEDSNFTWSGLDSMVASAAMSGLSSANAGITSTANMILGAPLKWLGWEDNPMQKLDDHYSGIADQYAVDARLYAQRMGGDWWDAASQTGTAVAAAIPMMLETLVSGGGSMMDDAASLTTKAMKATGGILEKAGLSVKGMMKNPQYWTSFARTVGPDYEEALQDGASESEAAITATAKSLVNAGIEIGLGGDSGIQGLLGELPEGGFKAWSKSSFAEGGEEALQLFVNETVAKVTYDPDREILNPEEYAKDAFMGMSVGSLLGGGQIATQAAVNGANNAVSNAVQEKERRTLTENEQKVVNAIYEQEIAEEEKNGKLTKRQKDKIYDRILTRMEKGYISTDTIEEILDGEAYGAIKGEVDNFFGGETYKAYNDTIDQEKALEQEIKEMGQKTGATLEEQYRFAELNRQLEELRASGKKDALKAQLDAEVKRIVGLKSDLHSQTLGKLGGDRLAESYNELIRKNQKFEVDVSKYENEYARQTMQNILDSDLGNNSTEFHELADFMARLSADKGTVFHVTNDERLSGTGNDFEGKRTDGFVTADGITINLSSDKALNSIVGHELTHTMEQTDMYNHLRDVLVEYAKGKKAKSSEFDSEYAERLARAQAKYGGIYQGVNADEDIKREVVADLVGEYLFTDSEFINNLSVQNRNVFQKIYDEIKYLYKMATAGSKEARELERVKKAFDEAYRADSKSAGDTKYSMSDSLQPTQARMVNIMASNIASEARKNGVSLAQYYAATEEINAYSPTKADALTIADALEPVVNQMDNENLKGYLDKIRSYAEDSDAKYSLSDSDGRQLTAEPDIRYSVSEDGKGREIRPAVLARFGNSKVVDESGRLKSVYHGTASGEFSIFDKAKGSVEGDFGSGFYFTDNEADVSEHYEDGGPDFENKVIRRAEQIMNEEDTDWDAAEEQAREELYKGGHRFEVYLNIENPAVVGETMLLESDSYFSQYDQEDYEDEDDYYGDVEQLVADDIENIIWEIERNTDVYSTEGISDILWGAFNDGGIGIEDLKTQLNNLYLEDSEGNLVANEVARQIIESLGYDGIIDPTVSGKWSMNIEEGTTHYIVFKPNQIKDVRNENPTDNPDIHLSLSENGERQTKHGDYHVYGKDVTVQNPLGEFAPYVEQGTEAEERWTEVSAPLAQSDLLEEIDDARAELAEVQPLLSELEERMERWDRIEDPEKNWDVYYRLVAEWSELAKRRDDAQSRLDTALNAYAPRTLQEAYDDSRRFESIDDSDAPAVMESSYADEENEATLGDPFKERDMYEVGRDKKQHTFMHDHPEFKPFFIKEAEILYGEYLNTVRGERLFNDQVYYESGGEKGWDAQPRMTSKSMEVLLDKWGMKYSDIEKGLKAIIENDGESRLASAKKIEFMLHDRLLHGYESSKYFRDGADPNQEYIEFFQEWQKTNSTDNTEAFDALMAEADRYAPPVTEDIGPVAEPAETKPSWSVSENKEPRAPKTEGPNVAKILTEEPKTAKRENGTMGWIRNNVLDKGMVFENLSLKTGNRELQARWNSIRYAEGKAQRMIGKGNASTQALDAIRKQVEKTGKTGEFYNYLYHLHNADRMTLAERFEDMENKPVFGSSVSAAESRAIAKQIEKTNPWVKQYAQDVYDYMGNLRDLMVENGIISKETAQRWQEMYPHYVPIRRTTDTGLDINVPLDTRRTGVNAPVKQATGGSADILPLFDTMGQRTIQTYKAIAKNRFGVELKNTLGTTISNEAASVDDTIDSIDAHEELLQAGERGQKPTFTVFENGEKVTFEITDEMYDAMKPVEGILAKTSKTLNTVGNVRRGLLTEYNPTFALTNPIKDAQDVLINSQHPVRTYANFPKAISELLNKNGHWYQEYMENGGEQNTYFERDSNTFAKEKTGIAKAIGMPLDKMSDINNFIERIPRMAEYIASRKQGRSIDVAMLDAARVTTNFAAGGDLTKFLNRNGATFLNASMQGAVQQVRNFREAKANGLKGVLGLAAKVAIAGLPSILLNHLLWEDDEEYEELSDYVKQNYYVVAKNDDGTFVRIPKGRTLAVIQNAFEQAEHLMNGEEADWGAALDLVISNLAPNNPLDNNIISPIVQVARNETWYGEDLVPSRLQDVPAAEQYDESTDALSKWLGETLDVSPYKVNYLLDQYSGGLGDTFLPMLTPEAESGDDSFWGNMIAPLRDKFTTDSTMNNQNVTDFYDLKDELKVNANSMHATEDDKLMSLYMNAISSDLADMYAEKRELQNSDESDAYKYERTREIQSDIVEMMKDGMSHYQNISYDDDYRGGGRYARIGDKVFKLNDNTGEWYKLTDDQLTKYEVTSAAGDANYATDGTNHYNWYVNEEGEAYWRKITDEQLEKQDEVTSGLGITPEEYWNKKYEYDFAYKYPENYAVAQAVGGYDSYKYHTGELYDLKADKDENGKSISGSRKTKVIDYINGLDIDYGMKLILFKNEYEADDTYNYEIIDYLNSRDDISAEQMETILKRLGFTVSSDGTITW